ncbi:MAG: cobalamin B12-binding domain-containing protein [Planctomycetota bacterium]|nr:cobalamin B12-binding domain-containing protein [Planctomycetota bacterium]
MARSGPIRILLAKPGLDGHDRGIRLVLRALRDAGMEVIYTGLRATADQIVKAAIEEDVDAIGLSSLSGAHETHFIEVSRLLAEQGASDVLLFGGGIIPQQDVERLREAGFQCIYPPGTSLETIVADLKSILRQEPSSGGNTS